MELREIRWDVQLASGRLVYRTVKVSEDGTETVEWWPESTTEEEWEEKFQRDIAGPRLKCQCKACQALAAFFGPTTPCH